MGRVTAGENLMLLRTGTYPVGVAVLIMTVWAGAAWVLGLVVTGIRDV